MRVNALSIHPTVKPLPKPNLKGNYQMKFVLSEETKRKMSDRSKGVPKSKEHAAKVGAKHKGKIVSEETKKRQSIAAKNRWRTAEDRIALSLAGTSGQVLTSGGTAGPMNVVQALNPQINLSSSATILSARV